MRLLLLLCGFPVSITQAATSCIAQCCQKSKELRRMKNKSWEKEREGKQIRITFKYPDILSLINKITNINLCELIYIHHLLEIFSIQKCNCSGFKSVPKGS